MPILDYRPEASSKGHLALPGALVTRDSSGAFYHALCPREAAVIGDPFVSGHAASL